jgi:hypothetical protein
LWWAGFAPFPQKPVTLATYQTADYCTIPAGSDNWAKCAPFVSDQTVFSSQEFRLFPSDATKAGFGPYGQYGIEGYNGCWDAGCADIFHEELFPSQTVTFRWKIYTRVEVPHYGLGAPRWVRILVATSGDKSYAESTYTTYSACIYRLPTAESGAFYKCAPIDPKAPWIVGKTTA